jgi:hypothetical protein
MAASTMYMADKRGGRVNTLRTTRCARPNSDQPELTAQGSASIIWIVDRRSVPGWKHSRIYSSFCETVRAHANPGKLFSASAVCETSERR